MSGFYIKTDLSVAGPFTGVEIREAALAGIIRPNSFLSATGEAPWVAAADAGLFNESGVAIPHPPGTKVPTYQTRGMPGAFMGPFKLRELIGFACQGMLPPGTELQSDPSRPWIPITGTGILPACLRGDLVRIEDGGRLLLRTVVPKDLKERKEKLKSVQSPIELARQVKVKGATSKPKLELSDPAASPTTSNPDQPPRAAPPTAADIAARAARGEVFEPSKPQAPPPAWRVTLGKFRKGAKQQIARAGQLLARPRIAIATLLLVASAIGLPLAYSARMNQPIARQAIYGQWISVVEGDPEQTSPEFAVKFTEDGQCVLMNATGHSWSGDYAWAVRQQSGEHFTPGDNLSISFDEISSGHVEAAVRPSDGYLRLQGFVKDPPTLHGHPVRDLFVRREGEQLMLGYLTRVTYDNDSQTLHAGWITARRMEAPQLRVADVIADLPEEKAPKTELGENAVTLSKAVENASQGVEVDYRGKRITIHGSFTFSDSVDTAYLMQEFGVADEARPMRGFEKPITRRELELDDAQVIRYADLKFIVDGEGDVFYVAFDRSLSES